MGHLWLRVVYLDGPYHITSGSFGSSELKGDLRFTETEANVRIADKSVLKEF